MKKNSVISKLISSILIISILITMFPVSVKAEDTYTVEYKKGSKNDIVFEVDSEPDEYYYGVSVSDISDDTTYCSIFSDELADKIYERYSITA